MGASASNIIVLHLYKYNYLFRNKCPLILLFINVSISFEDLLQFYFGYCRYLNYYKKKISLTIYFKYFLYYII